MEFLKNFSLEGKVALVTGGAYGIGFAMAEALAMAGARITFNCRSQENMDKTASLREIQPDGSKHPFDRFIMGKTPAGRWGEPEDLMGPTVFLASDASNFVNGQILYVDGGIAAYFGKQPK